MPNRNQKYNKNKIKLILTKKNDEKSINKIKNKNLICTYGWELSFGTH